MKNTLSPRDLAVIIDVSESSVKRWADAGTLHVVRTAGGHRRIRRDEAIRFIREAGIHVVHPQLLGFAEARDAIENGAGAATEGEILFEALRDGRRDRVLGLVQGWFLAGRALAWIFDGPVAAAMTRIGELWLHQGDGVLLEHRATDLCIQAVTQLRLALPPECPDAPVAVGASPSADPYLLPSIMAATVLQDVGMRAINLGPETPLEVLQAAAVEHHARLAWLSLSTDAGAKNASVGMGKLGEVLEANGTHLVVGGRTAGCLKSTLGGRLIIIDSMAELAAFATGLMTNAPRETAGKPTPIPFRDPDHEPDYGGIG